MSSKTVRNQKLTLQLDYRLLCMVLVIVIVVMVGLWRPWQTRAAEPRTITITGQATVTSEPDEYQFSPYYERATTSEIASLNDELVRELKKLGVTDSQIKNNASRYGTAEMPAIAPVDRPEVSTLSVTITLRDKKLVQKVQDYLLTTNPKGSVSPFATFSTAKQKELQDEARDKAIADARFRAERTANGLGASLGEVQEVDEAQSAGLPFMGSTMMAEEKAADAAVSLPVQPGVNEYNYSVSVTFTLE